MAPVLFYSYNLVVFFILLNMFLAIVADSYAEVKGNQSPEDLNFYRNMLDALSNKIKKLFKKRDQIKDFKSSLMSADADADALISEEELMAALAHNPKAVEMLKLTGVKDLMAKYDLSNDGQLSKEELKAILQDLALKEAEIQEEIQDKVEEHAKVCQQPAKTNRTL
jgi:polycystin 2